MSAWTASAALDTDSCVARAAEAEAAEPPAAAAGAAAAAPAAEAAPAAALPAQAPAPAVALPNAWAAPPAPADAAQELLDSLASTLESRASTDKPPSPFFAVADEDAPGERPEPAARGAAGARAPDDPETQSAASESPTRARSRALAPLLLARRSVLLGEPTPKARPPATPAARVLRRLTSLGSAVAAAPREPLGEPLGDLLDGADGEVSPWAGGAGPPGPLRPQRSLGALLGRLRGAAGDAGGAGAHSPAGAPLRSQRSLGVLLGIRNDPDDAPSDEDSDADVGAESSDETDVLDGAPLPAGDADADPEKGLDGSIDGGPGFRLRPPQLQRRSVHLGMPGAGSPSPSARALRRLARALSGGVQLAEGPPPGALFSQRSLGVLFRTQRSPGDADDDEADGDAAHGAARRDLGGAQSPIQGIGQGTDLDPELGAAGGSPAALWPPADQLQCRSGAPGGGGPPSPPPSARLLRRLARAVSGGFAGGAGFPPAGALHRQRSLGAPARAPDQRER